MRIALAPSHSTRLGTLALGIIAGLAAPAWGAPPQAARPRAVAPAAKAAPVPARTPAARVAPPRASALPGVTSGGKSVDQPLRVQGQSRNLNMMLILKGEKDKIRFGEIRENYKREIQQTQY